MRCSRPCLSPHEETAYSPSVRGGPQTWELWLWASAAPLITGVCVFSAGVETGSPEQKETRDLKVSRSNKTGNFISAVDSPRPPTSD